LEIWHKTITKLKGKKIKPSQRGRKQTNQNKEQR